MRNSPNTNSGSGAAWFRSPYLLLPVVAIVVALAIIFRPPAPRTAVAVPAAAAIPTGPNLLRNPGFLKSGAGWTAFHNAMPMHVTFGTIKAEKADVALGNAKNSVQEIFQYASVDAGSALVAGGQIGIAGAPLPAGASVVCMLIDASGKPTNVFSVGSSAGTGVFPFRAAYTPSGAKVQFVMGIFLGPTPGSGVTVTLKNLYLRKAAVSTGTK